MSSLSHLRLSPADKTAIHRLHRTIRATRYEDPVDQEAFLTASGKTLLQFQQFITSFAQNHDLGECVFALKHQINLNNARLGVASNDLSDSLHSFTSDILAKRQEFRDRKAEHGERLRAAAGFAARAEWRATLETLNRQANHFLICFLLSPANFPPSSTVLPVLPTWSRFPPVMKTLTLRSPMFRHVAAPVPQVPLSPLPELEGLLLNLSFSTPLNIPIASHLSPTLSLPDHVLRRAHQPSGLNPTIHGKALPPTVPVSDAVPVQPSLPALVLPAKPAVPTLICRLPFGPRPRRPQINYVDDWMEYNLKFTGSRARKSSSSGSSSRSKRRAVKIRKLKSE
ncbi:hypothetical protein C8R45DRAFT_942653 [Mycena sanguinolenta]|nr:hypothetical protein C8R45DRAFT_942653 [Mycena sanguinolenta]